VSLGCSKNIVDSEMILGSLLENGCILTGNHQEAEFVVINTCGFIENAREESVDAIVEALENRSQGQKILVAGCLSQRYGKELLEEMPDIDACLGINAPVNIVDAALSLIRESSEACVRIEKPGRKISPAQSRYLLTPTHFAYLRIADGCDQGCKFCAIPRIRGRQRSRSLPDLLDEARQLTELGCRELCLVAHDLVSWGVDLDDEYQLETLLFELNEIENLDWIRLFYLYPRGLSDAMIEAMATCEKVLPYIDMPLQHITDNMLKAMNRRVDRHQTEELLDKLDSALPEAVRRTTLLVGYPGESDEDFEALLEFINLRKFHFMGAFAYSPEEGTASFHMDRQVPSEIAQDRLEALMLAQQKITFAHQESRLGQTEMVVVDEIDSDWARCRSWREAPDCDPLILLPPDNRRPGEIIEVRLLAREEYDLLAEI